VSGGPQSRRWRGEDLRVITQQTRDAIFKGLEQRAIEEANVHQRTEKIMEQMFQELTALKAELSLRVELDLTKHPDRHWKTPVSMAAAEIAMDR
jgi:hypothetical protein